MALKTYAKIERYERCEKNNKYEYIKIGEYIQDMNEINQAIDGEFDGWDYEGFSNSNFYIKITPIKMSEEEFKKLPEFMGY